MKDFVRISTVALFFVCSCASLTVLAATTVQAKTFFVDPNGDDNNSGGPNFPFATVQRGINEAAITPGPDTVRIAAGNYVENVTINDKDPVTLRGAGSGATVVFGDDDPVTEDNVITMGSGDVEIRRLMITGGFNGISATGDSLRLDDVVVSENDDRGLDAIDIDSVRIDDGEFSNNVDSDGIKVESAGTVKINGTNIESNGSDGIDLEVIDDIDVTNVTVANNGDEGLEVDDSGSIDVVGGTYTNNNDDGLDIDDTARIDIVNVESTGNGNSDPVPDGNGLQIEAQDFDSERVKVVNSEFSGNTLDGINIAENPSSVDEVRLTAITARDNGESGLDLGTVTGTVKLKRIVSGTAEGNGLEDVLP